tara:strand:+ start:340 stop:882 length:543 start_codon:yes stop_codon:yes gene_type:complete
MKIEKKDFGYPVWVVEDIFKTGVVEEVLEQADHLPYVPMEGKRTDKTGKRIWMNQYDWSSFVEVCELFDSDFMKNKFSEVCEKDFSKLGTRIELCKDAKGSWLHNHFDDKAKLFTLQLYLSDTDTSTSFMKTNTPARKNSGWFFANTATELHGLKPLLNDRVSIIVNYCDETWRDRSVIV